MANYDLTHTGVNVQTYLDLIASLTVTAANINSAVGIANSLASWAKASTKPSYAFSEITGNITNASIIYYNSTCLIDTSTGKINTSLLPTYSGSVS